ncbi:hypothetical protein ABZ721_22235 [Streptomyces sp. NPDC006733]|uniref:hypothetical protein n=1 Tax=Streptomyces sp. NPDC006733 TaxID=3155460 RepID=UPI0033F25E7A
MKKDRRPPPPFGLDEKTYGELWFYALPVLGVAVGVAVFAGVLGVMPDHWWGAVVAGLAGVAGGVGVVVAGRRVRRALRRP